jgi:hypothetical protein
MGSVGDAYDNAICESFFATLECELLDREIFRTRSEAKLAIFNYIEVFYNRWPRHTSIGSVSPVAYEAAYGEAKPPNRRAIAQSGGHLPPRPPTSYPTHRERRWPGNRDANRTTKGGDRR